MVGFTVAFLIAQSTPLKRDYLAFLIIEKTIREDCAFEYTTLDSIVR